MLLPPTSCSTKVSLSNKLSQYPKQFEPRNIYERPRKGEEEGKAKREESERERERVFRPSAIAASEKKRERDKERERKRERERVRLCFVCARFILYPSRTYCTIVAFAPFSFPNGPPASVHTHRRRQRKIKKAALSRRRRKSKAAP